MKHRVKLAEQRLNCVDGNGGIGIRFGQKNSHKSYASFLLKKEIAIAKE